ncbi:Eco57I restriction-modification methylase domain-containing protein, partial [Aeromicrobium sp.]|uniref:Eco57I restriction-modification methylase domain-containing protein n=1 Tax=Aeromicrobium sp. TaxID=1871063 RepID=UPI003D6A3897
GGGFQAVVGNPPYLNVDSVWGKNDPRLAYIKSAYSSIHTDKTDILFYFLKRSVDICQGEVGMIVSRSFLEADKAQHLREWLSTNSRVREVLDFRQAHVFPKVGINTAIVRFTKSKHTKQARFRRYLHRDLPPDFTADTLRDSGEVSEVLMPMSELGRSAWNFGEADVRTLMAKIDSAGTQAGSILHIGKGMETGANKAFSFEPGEKRVAELVQARQLYRRARNSDIRPYRIAEAGPRTLYVEDSTAFGQLPADVRAHLSSHRTTLESRAAYQRGDCLWWKFTWPLHKEFFDRPRIICPYRASWNRFALDEQRKFLGLTDTTVLYENGQPEDLRYILALLNSRTLTARFRFIGKLIGGGNYEYYENTVRKLPIPRRSAGDADHDQIVELVKKIEAATEARDSTIVTSEIAELDQEIASTHASIESEVQKLFDLSDDEKELLEAQL